MIHGETTPLSTPAPDAHGPGMENSLDPLSAAVFTAFRTAFHQQRRLMTKALADEGVHPGQAACLRLLDQRDGVSQRELADSLHLSRPRVTGMVQELEREGHVTRCNDEQDRRLTRVHLTAKGRHKAGELREVFAECIGRTIGALPEHDRRELIRLLEALDETTAQALEEDR